MSDEVCGGNINRIMDMSEENSTSCEYGNDNECRAQLHALPENKRKQNGIPVCPEKKRSAPEVNALPISLGAERVLSGDGPRWVMQTKSDRTTMNTAIAFKVKGTLFG